MQDNINFNYEYVVSEHSDAEYSNKLPAGIYSVRVNNAVWKPAMSLANSYYLEISTRVIDMGNYTNFPYIIRLNLIRNGISDYHDAIDTKMSKTILIAQRFLRDICVACNIDRIDTDPSELIGKEFNVKINDLQNVVRISSYYSEGVC